MTPQSPGDMDGSHPRAPPWPLQGDTEKDLERLDGESSTSAPEATEPTPRDPSVVSWDGPDDPENPLNWPLARKAAAIGVVSAITFLSPLASSISAPGIPQVMSDFKSTNEELASFIVSVYVLGYCFGPLAIAPLSEIYGRAPLYNICNVGFLVFTVACAVAPNLGALVVFRLLAGLAGSCPMALGPGTIADLVARERRGKVMAAWVSGPLLGPVIGPIAGGYLTQAKGWRWSFWLLAIAGGVVMLASFVMMRETYAYAILNRKTKKLRKETGNQGLRSSLDNGHSSREIFATAIVRPSKMLIFSPIVFLLSLYMCILYGYLYLIFTALPDLFQHEYGFSTGQVGLTYLGIGAGSALGLVVCGAASDRLVETLRRKHGGEFKPEYRLPLMVIAGSAVPIGLFWFGWTAQAQRHWILPIIGTSFLGFGMTLAFMAISTYLVDAFGAFAASAVAASTVLRSLGGAVLPLAGGKMFVTLGFGWGSSLLAFIALAMIPVPIVFFRYGEHIRKKNLLGVKF
ncbi:major facilitator superfamily protein [Hirsutella rhossiliensis]|uniref:Major facilitator superfamily domain-containing protein n=1 Tax=Hirsutella rhossiliensis TaxID=111463 RepID=A0A9P8SMS3_9HYPO|nr:major facilitator superfamily domain-containing protein [Hirsutella rhossiliensis]KAH0968311.1 major facilitator superfamily domain-containing protein [Hirsutella rhossiliensis]